MQNTLFRRYVGRYLKERRLLESQAQDSIEVEVAKRRFSAIGIRQLQNVTHALIREWSNDVAISPRGQFVDFKVISRVSSA